MRSIYITADSVGPGSGGGIVTLNEIEALKSISDEVVVISRKDVLPEKFKQPDSVFLYDYFALNLIKAIAGKFDLAHLYSGTFSNTVGYLKSQGTKVSYTVPAHDRHITVDEFQRQGVEYPYSHIKDDNLWYMFSRGYREADLIITPSNVSAKFMQLESCRNVKVISHGCYLPDKVTDIDTSKKVVGYLGQAGIDKGIIYLLKAWESLDLRDAELVFAGACSETMKQWIPRVVGKGKYRVLGYLPNVSDFYNNISVLVQPSVCESFGIEVIEAAAHGRPVIVSDGAGSSELVNGNIGYVVSSRSPDSIAWAVRDIFATRDLNMMGRNARDMATEYTWEKVGAKYISAWKEMIGFSLGIGD